MHPSHYASCPSVCPVWAHNSRTKIIEKIDVNVPQGSSKWNANFELKRLKVKVKGRKEGKNEALERGQRPGRMRKGGRAGKRRGGNF